MQFANVFTPLEGKWQGRFHVYEDSLGQRAGKAQPEISPGFDLNQLPLKLILTIDVQQEYTSETPYFQRVKITDTYRDASGGKKTEKSVGVNKIENGKLWCVVKKPDETVIHSGRTEGVNVIIWQRELHNPLKIEYFRETVLENEYHITGWGYYGDDDPNLTPQLWFEALYHRVER